MYIYIYLYYMLCSAMQCIIPDTWRGLSVSDMCVHCTICSN